LVDGALAERLGSEFAISFSPPIHTQRRGRLKIRP